MPNEEQLTERQLGFATWFVQHKPTLKRLGLGALIAFDILMVGFGLYGLVDHYLISWNRDVAISARLGRATLSHDAVSALAPAPLTTPGVNIFPSGTNRYDLLAEVQNQNKDWYATFRYQFDVGGEKTPEASGFVLPAEKKYLAQFTQTFKSPPRLAEFRLTSIAWHHLDHHVIRDYDLWQHERQNFEVANVTHTTMLSPTDRTVGRTSFNITNRSAYGYWRVGVFVVLLRATSPVAVNYITLDNLDSGEKRHVDVNWFELLPSSSTVDIHPEVNLFDANSYMPPRAE